jgi:YggT family protein
MTQEVRMVSQSFLGSLMLFYLISAISWIFNIYIFLMIIRIVGSWFPAIAHHKLMYFVAFYVDPYLNIFRRLIPPIGGVLDLSPLLAFFSLEILKNIILYALIWLGT